MITAISYRNFKALRDTTLPLGRFTLIVGPNGSGKSTAMEAFRFVLNPGNYDFSRTVTASTKETAFIEISMSWEPVGINKTIHGGTVDLKAGLRRDNNSIEPFGPEALRSDRVLSPDFGRPIKRQLARFRLFSFNAQAISASVTTEPNPQLKEDGSNLAAVLDALTDIEPERFEALNQELQRWLPEFDRILFETPKSGQKAFLLRTRVGHHRYQASDLSQGTLFALALLTVAYLPSPPPIVCFEEPDHGIHPRLLHEIRDGMYRLAYPENFGENRNPVQVIATTHSPYLLDLYKEHPEEVVIANKQMDGVQFERLSEKPNVKDFLEGAPLGDVWLSGILGGVPANP